MISARCRYDAHDTFDEEEASVHFMSSGKDPCSCSLVGRQHHKSRFLT